MEIAQALTLLVSVLVLIVSYSQWRTANQKVVVDLYDRRLKVFNGLKAAVILVMREAEADRESFQKFIEAEADAEFLFGEDVQSYLKSLRRNFAWLLSFTNEVIDHSDKRAELIDEKYKHIKHIVDFFQDAPPLFGPYVRLDQKNTPFWRPW